jgi:manganese/zinc/iron transport system permease protein
MISSVLGAFFSFLRSNLPTGPCMVVAASSIFVVTLLFSPLHGMVPRTFQRIRRRRRADMENLLKAIYSIGEQQNQTSGAFPITEVATKTRRSAAEISRVAERLAGDGLAVLEQNRATIRLSKEGQRQAGAILRKHRLWELYLTEQANYRPDHVHADAEEMEHLLGDDTIKMLERRLGYPKRDPHGRSIPRPE